MKSTLEDSYRYCEQLARRSGSNFVVAFRSLPREMYRQMCVLYAFMRHTDDLSDEEHLPLTVRREELCRWQEQLIDAIEGRTISSQILPALADTVHRQQIPACHLLEVIHGVEGDLTPREFQTFSELEHYCYQVAGVVGLCCIRIWGFQGDEPAEPAIACGTAFQLTNILRDLKEDAQRGRCYLPASELQASGYSNTELKNGIPNAAFQTLMTQQIVRAWTYYQQAYELRDHLHPAGRRIFLAFFDLYSSLLHEIEQSRADVLSRRIRVSRWKKARVAIGCLLRLDSRSRIMDRLSASTPAAVSTLERMSLFSNGTREP